MQGLRPLTDTQTCPRLWSGWAASGTPGPPLSSKSSGVRSLVVLRGPCLSLLGGGQLSRDPQSVEAGQQRRSGQGGPAWVRGRTRALLGGVRIQRASDGGPACPVHASLIGTARMWPAAVKGWTMRLVPSPWSATGGSEPGAGTVRRVQAALQPVASLGGVPGPLRGPLATPESPCQLPGQQVLEDGGTPQLASLCVAPQLPGPTGTRGGTGGGTWGCPPTVRPPC